jgi:hypothetical protein
MPQTDGFHPGNYAALRSGPDLEHVLLVSPVGGDAKDAPEWFVLGYLGTARLAKTDQLVGVPISFEPKVNAPVLARAPGQDAARGGEGARRAGRLERALRSRGPRGDDGLGPS